MDRRQRKTRERIFKAFTELLSQKDVNKITVGDIIEKADVGRATFYAHFPTKDFLIKDLNEELFCHVFDSVESDGCHKHIFKCEETRSIYLHLFKHLQNNDNGILDLLSGENNELFLRYFKEGLKKLIEKDFEKSEYTGSEELPKAFFINHLAATYVETVRWWVDNNLKETPEEITHLYLTAINLKGHRA